MTKPQMLHEWPLKKCPDCGDAHIEVNYVGWSVLCDCYDGAPDAGPQLISTSIVSIREAVDNWNELIEEDLT